jgi:uncharacterized membrane protein
MTTPFKRMAGFLVLALLTGPVSRGFATTQPVAPVIDHEPAPVIAHQSATSAHTYAAREVASAAKVEKFKGGGTAVYIGGSTLVVVLLVVLIVILI